MRSHLLAAALVGAAAAYHPVIDDASRPQNLRWAAWKGLHVPAYATASAEAAARSAFDGNDALILSHNSQRLSCTCVRIARAASTRARHPLDDAASTYPQRLSLFARAQALFPDPSALVSPPFRTAPPLSCNGCTCS